jgi:predicted permease
MLVTFCVSDPTVFRQYGYADPDELFLARPLSEDSARDAYGSLSWREVSAWRQRDLGFGFTAIAVGEPTYFIRPLRREFRTAGIDRTFFELLRESTLYGGFSSEHFMWRPAPESGRVFQPVLISYRLWQLWLNSDRSVIGTSIEFGNREGLRTGVVIAGVLRREFVFPVESVAPDILTPITAAGERSQRYVVVVRLPEEISASHASQQLAVAAREARTGPTRRLGTGKDAMGFEVAPLHAHLGATRRFQFLTAVGCAIGLFLLTSLNAAALTTARLGRRSHELAIRLALGATSTRLTTAQLTEVGILCAVAVVLALVLTPGAIRVVGAVLPDAAETLRTPHVNIGRVIVAAAIAVVVAVPLIGLLPAIGVITSTKCGTGLWSSLNERLMRPYVMRAIIAGEVALAFVLVMAGSLTIGTIANLWNLDTGYRRERMLVLELYADQYSTSLEAAGRLQELTTSFKKVPGVVDLALASIQPMFAQKTPAYSVVKPVGAEAMASGVASRRVTSNYFRMLSIELRRGRWPTDEEWQPRTPSALVSEAAASRLWPTEGAVGRFLEDSAGGQPIPIVGVVADVKYGGLEAEPLADIYLPGVIDSSTTGVYAIVTTGEANVLPVLMAMAARSDVIAHQASSFNQALFRLMQPRVVVATLFGVFGLVAWCVSMIGCISLVAILVTERAGEMTIRSVLGASRVRLLGASIRVPMEGVVVGLAIGTAMVASASRALQSLLFGVHVLQPSYWFAVAGTQAICVLLAAVAVWYRRPTELRTLLHF